MTLKAIDTIEETWYTPKSETGKSDPTRFRIRGMYAIEYMAVVPELKNIGKVLVPTKEGSLMILSYGLHGWENFKNGAGKDIDFTGDVETDSKKLDISIANELMREIVDRSVVSREQEKN